MNPETIAALISLVGVVLIGVFTIYFQIENARNLHREKWMVQTRKALRNLIRSLEELRLEKKSTQSAENALLAEIIGNITLFYTLLTDDDKQKELIEYCDKLRSLADSNPVFSEYEEYERKIITETRKLLKEEFNKIKRTTIQFKKMFFICFVIIAIVITSLLNANNITDANKKKTNERTIPANINVNINGFEKDTSNTIIKKIDTFFVNQFKKPKQ